MDGAFETDLASIGIGTRLILAMTLPSEAYTVNAGDVAWAFSIPQPQVTHTLASLSYNVDAGDVAWEFSIPQPQVTHTTAAPISHTINAGDVAWTFSIPQPQVTHTTAVTISHTVNAGDVAWAFSIPQPAVTHTIPVANNYSVNAGNVAWAFNIPRVFVTGGTIIADAWPTEFPSEFTRASFRETFSDNVLRQPNSAGPERRRPLSTRVDRILSGDIVMNTDELNGFKDWFLDTAEGGVLNLYFPDPYGSGAVLVCFFSGEPTWRSIDGGNYRVSMALHVPATQDSVPVSGPIWPPGVPQLIEQRTFQEGFNNTLLRTSLSTGPQDRRRTGRQPERRVSARNTHGCHRGGRFQGMVHGRYPWWST